MKKLKWFDRDFNFDTQQNIFPSIVERLAGTPARLEEKLTLIKPEWLNIKIDGAWSIKEQIGHLADIEPLWQGRFEDIAAGKRELRATDLQNTKTDLANHNGQAVNDLLIRFRKAREQTLSMLENIEEALIFKTALHPRLKTPMRTMDHFLFVADHDDHHLATITEIAKQLSAKDQ